jgi:HSP20 family molecular chaperone IbpA
MRYRRLSYRYAMIVRAGGPSPLGALWPWERVRLLVEARWRPDADTYETTTAVGVVVDLAGVGEDDFEVQLFEDALVIEGRRALPACEDGAVYHAASIRQGAFRLEVPLPASVDADRVEARYERGLLRITLPKAGGSR